MDKLRQFFNENEVRVGAGKDFVVIPPIYYASLRDAFQNYFSSFRDKRLKFSFLLNIKDWRTANLSADYTGADENLIFTILGFHRFFELLLKDILRRIDPLLALKTFEKEEEVFQLVDKKLNLENIKTIEYGETIKRFKYAFKHYASSDVYETKLKAYEFLKTEINLESLSYLAEWRNRIMHNGTTFPNLIAFEYLITQRIVPIVQQVLSAEKPLLDQYEPHYLKSATGINLLDELLGVKFNIADFSDAKKAQQLALLILKLQHIKEIGRATTLNLPMLRKNRDFYEHIYNDPIGRSERFAEVEKEKRGDVFYRLIPCNCCGTKSKVVYRMEHESLFGRREFNTWFKCFHCDYSLLNIIGDPFDFGLSKERIFPTK